MAVIKNIFDSQCINSLLSPQVCVVMTDGLTNPKENQTFNFATEALRRLARVIAVGVAGKGYDAKKRRQQREELRQIASTPQDLFYEASFEQVRDHVDPIAKRACPLNFI